VAVGAKVQQIADNRSGSPVERGGWELVLRVVYSGEGWGDFFRLRTLVYAPVLTELVARFGYKPWHPELFGFCGLVI
jgi:hypothetical protein